MRSLGKAIVGMSGGVDSAVSAWLLKQAGYDVTGVYMINWDHVEEGVTSCSRATDEIDAQRTCERLQIPFHTVNFVKQYWNEVFTELLDNYKIGRTTVPDVQCNRAIKFEHLHKFAIEKLDADYIATGHYARSNLNWNDPLQVPDKVRLFTPLDPLKDQTFFLCTLRQHQLKRALFPLGELTKTQVRSIANEQGLSEVESKPESMGICFVGKRRKFESFLNEYIENRTGDIISTSGRYIGSHSGIHNFTIGKRVHTVSGSHLGIFVQHLDVERNVVIVCEGSHHPSLYATRFLILEPEWIGERPSTETRISCRIQRTHTPIPCKVHNRGSAQLIVEPHLPLRAVAPGQMCVFYCDHECLGGGQVVEVVSTL